MSNPTENSKKKPLKAQSDITRYSSMGVKMLLVIGVFCFAGIKLDSVFVNHYSLFTIFFSLAGVFGALYSVYKEVTRNVE